MSFSSFKRGEYHLINPSTLFMLLTGAIILLIVIVAVLERTLNRKREETVQTQEYAITQELNELKRLRLDPKDMLSKIDALAKKTLWTNQGLENAPDYSQLAEISSTKPHIASFCSEMAKNLYAGQSITQNDVRSLIKSLEETLKEEGKIILVEQKHEKIAEEKFFMDKWIEGISLKLSSKINSVKSNEEDVKFDENKKENIEEARNDIREINPSEELKKLKVKIVPEKSSKSKAKRNKERNEYRYIESLDVLDRIKSRISTRNVQKTN